jgi:hypothetical protein
VRDCFENKTTATDFNDFTEWFFGEIRGIRGCFLKENNQRAAA